MGKTVKICLVILGLLFIIFFLFFSSSSPIPGKLARATNNPCGYSGTGSLAPKVECDCSGRLLSDSYFGFSNKYCTKECGDCTCSIWNETLENRQVVDCLYQVDTKYLFPNRSFNQKP